VLHKVIARQYAFLEGRGILDSVLEQMKFWKKSRGERAVVCSSRLTMRRCTTKLFECLFITCWRG